jgi:hypothetical protein
MSTSNIKPKSADLPPRGLRNADPITDAAGAHPIETGIGAAAGGAAAGFAAGMAAGPVGAVAGAIVGGIAGGYGGKAVGEWIDPTTDPTFQDEFATRPYVDENQTFDDYKPVYQYGGQAESINMGKPFSEVESSIKKDYEKCPASRVMPWKSARPAVQDAYNRAQQLRNDQSAI